MLKWLERHTEIIQSIGALITIVLAVIALLGVKWQIDGAAQIQREQSARDIYREFLSLSVANPDLVSPEYCAIMAGPRAASYTSYVDYMLYAAEQSLALDPGLAPMFTGYFADHEAALCALTDADLDLYEPAVADLIATARAPRCPQTPTCP